MQDHHNDNNVVAGYLESNGYTVNPNSNLYGCDLHSTDAAKKYYTKHMSTLSKMNIVIFSINDVAPNELDAIATLLRDAIPIDGDGHHVLLDRVDLTVADTPNLVLEPTALYTHNQSVKNIDFFYRILTSRYSNKVPFMANGVYALIGNAIHTLRAPNSNPTLKSRTLDGYVPHDKGVSMWVPQPIYNNNGGLRRGELHVVTKHHTSTDASDTMTQYTISGDIKTLPTNLFINDAAFCREYGRSESLGILGVGRNTSRVNKKDIAKIHVDIQKARPCESSDFSIPAIYRGDTKIFSLSEMISRMDAYGVCNDTTVSFIKRATIVIVVNQHKSSKSLYDYGFIYGENITISPHPHKIRPKDIVIEPIFMELSLIDLVNTDILEGTIRTRYSEEVLAAMDCFNVVYEGEYIVVKRNSNK